MSPRDDAAFIEDFIATLRRAARLYRNPDGSRYVAPPAVREGKQALAGFEDQRRLWREDIPALIKRALRSKSDDPSVSWLGILVQYTGQIEHHTRGDYPPQCACCEKLFTVSFLPEVIIVTRDITDPEVDIRDGRIGGMCRDCASFDRSA